MAVVGLLLAFAVGAVAAATMSVFGFIALLTSLFVMGTLAAVAVSDTIGSAVASAAALFASAQVGYGLGLAVLARRHRRRDDPRRRPLRRRK